MREMMQQALSYVEKGYYVVPLECFGKNMFNSFELRFPSMNKKLVEFWWTIMPDANVGLPTSLRYNGLIIIDIDVKNGRDGRESLERIKTEITLPKTSIVRTGSGGYHLYYKNGTGIRLWGAKNVLPGIDIRAENAHVVAPPSINHNRQKYEWVEGGPDSLNDVDENVMKLLLMIKRNQGGYV